METPLEKSFDTSFSEASARYAKELEEKAVSLASQIKQPLKDVSAMVSDVKNYAQEVEKTIRILKKISKQERDPHTLVTIEKNVEEIEKTVVEVKEALQQAKALKAHTECTDALLLNISHLSSLKNRCNKRIALLQHKRVSPQESGIGRFDHWIKAQKTSDKENGPWYNVLLDIAKKVQFKTEPLKPADISFLHALQGGNYAKEFFDAFPPIDINKAVSQDHTTVELLQKTRKNWEKPLIELSKIVVSEETPFKQFAESLFALLEGKSQAIENFHISTVKFPVPIDWANSNREEVTSAASKILGFRHLKIPQREKEAFYQWTTGIIDEYQTTQARKSRMLTQVMDEYRNERETKKNSMSPSEWKERQIYFRVLYDNILTNPLDMAVKFTLPPLEEDLKNTQYTFSETTLKAKHESLQRLKTAHALGGNAQDIVISGTGPAGLMYALMNAVCGRPSIILEARKEGAKTRENLVALGEDSDPHAIKILTTTPIPADIQLLNFFGITDELMIEKKASFGRLEANIFEAKIGDLQEAMIHKLCMLTNKKKDELVQYHTTITTIEEKEERTEVTLSNNTQLTPSVLVVAEGAHSTTRDLLGIDLVPQSKKTRMAFSIFEKEEKELSVRQKLHAKTSYALSGLAKASFDLIGAKARSLVSRQDIVEGLFSQLERVALLLGTPKADYFFATLRPKEEELLKKIDTQKEITLAAADDLLKVIKKELEENKNSILNEQHNILSESIQEIEKALLDPKHSLILDSTQRASFFDRLKALAESIPEKKEDAILRNKEEKIRTLSSQLTVIDKQYAQLLEEFSVRGRHAFRLAYRIQKKDAKGGISKKYTKSYLVSPQVQRAETNYQKRSGAHCFLIGDVESTTDPIAGAGFRTAILRAELLHSATNTPSKLANPFFSSLFQWSATRASESMREEGLSQRTDYRTATETTEHYLDIAEDVFAITPQEKETIRRLETKVKIAHLDPQFTITQEEREALKTIQKSLQEKYFTEANFPQDSIEKHLFARLTQCQQMKNSHITPKEKDLMFTFLSALCTGKTVTLSETEKKQLKEASSKLAFLLPEKEFSPTASNHVPESWFLYLSLLCYDSTRK